METNRKNSRHINASDTKILSEFQATICRNDSNPCQFWDRGCTTKQNACHKLSDFKRRAKQKVLKTEEEEKKNKKSAYVAKVEIKDAIVDAIDLIDQLLLIDIPLIKSKRTKMSAIRSRLSNIING